MLVFPDFADELKGLDQGITVVPNPNRPQLANVFLRGVEICAIPVSEIREEPDPSYTITFPNGFVAKHKSRQEALAIVKGVLENIKTKEGSDMFFNQE